MILRIIDDAGRTILSSGQAEGGLDAPPLQSVAGLGELSTAFVTDENTGYTIQMDLDASEIDCLMKQVSLAQHILVDRGLLKGPKVKR